MYGIQSKLADQRPFANHLLARFTLLFIIGTLLSSISCDAQLLHHKKKVNKSTTPDNTAEPDKVLYGRGMDDIKHGRHEVGRLSMQTLINTYPDSEYLAKAKLAIADSYFKEGGTSNLTQAIQGYKDFIVFFPFLPEAPYAQLQVANAHYREITKPDRDRTEARLAEDEFQTFLQKYPHDPLTADAEQKLRNVQEIIAEGDYRIGYFYYVRGDKRAAAARLASLTQRYPLYSKSDKALWMLGNIFETSEHKEIASLYYSQIVRNYPLSPEAGYAKNKLVAFKVPVPQADPKAVAWMTAEQNAPRQKESFVKKPLTIMHSGPRAEIMAAARNGTPNLQPEADTTSATDILSGGNRSSLGGAGATGNTAVIETVTPGTAAATPSAAAGETPASTEAPAPPATTATPAATPAAAPTSSPTVTPAPAPPAGSSALTSPDANAAAPATGATATTPAAATDGSQTSSTSSTTPDSNQKESTSKKKKGIHKIIPW